MEANRKHQNENKLHHTVCLRERHVTVCRPDPKETSPTQVPLRPLVPCGWILHLGGLTVRVGQTRATHPALPVPRQPALFHVLWAYSMYNTLSVPRERPAAPRVSFVKSIRDPQGHS